ncbi:unnamed protein product [Prunus armeniaca]
MLNICKIQPPLLDVFSKFNDCGVRLRLLNLGILGHNTFGFLFASRSSQLHGCLKQSLECGARLVYERDLKKFCRLVYVDKAVPIGSSGSGSSDDEIEPGSDSSDDNHEPGIGSSDDDNEPGSYSSDDDDEPISKIFKKV